MRRLDNLIAAWIITVAGILGIAGLLLYFVYEAYKAIL